MQRKHKNFLAIPLVVGLVLSLFASLNTPAATTINLRFLHNFSAYTFDENTTLLRVMVTDNDDNIFIFTATGETEINMLENSVLKQFDVDVTINKIHADTPDRASSRTRVKLILTNPSDDNVYDGYLPTSSVTDNSSFYSVTWSHTLPVDNMTTMSLGNWVLRTEYDVYAIPENLAP